MSYRALLFCPDPKTAHVVTQILGDLDFEVDPCHEPAAAVAKLSEAHWDAVVVDCADDQNAALLFKQARESGGNPQTLAVAVVDGKSGIAAAFRLGANLVLTKPISIEQSKSTLRVARRLLAGNGNGKSETTSRANSPSANTHTAIDSIGSTSGAMEDEPEPQPEPAVAALYESPDAGESGDSADQEIPAVSLHVSAMDAVKTAKAVSAQASTAHTSFSSGAAAAPALAREPDTVEIEEEPVAAIAPAATSKHPAKLAKPKSGKTIQMIVLIALLIAAAAVGLWQWRSMHSAVPATASPVGKPVTLPPVATTQPSPPAGAATQTAASPAISGQPTSTPAAPVANPPQSVTATPAAPQSAADVAASQPASEKAASAPAAAPTPKGKPVGANATSAKSSLDAKPRQ